MAVMRADSAEVAGPICEALGLEMGRVQRIIIDFNVNSPVMVYVQMLADERILKIDWEAALKGAEVIKEVNQSEENEFTIDSKVWAEQFRNEWISFGARHRISLRTISTICRYVKTIPDVFGYAPMLRMFVLADEETLKRIPDIGVIGAAEIAEAGRQDLAELE